MAILCVAESRPRAVPLRDWLAGQWGLVFSHPEDFQESGLEQDRWLTLLAQEFSAAQLKPLACLPSSGLAHISWVNLLTGDHSLVPLEGSVADLAARQLRSEISSLQGRFVLVIDESLHRRGLLPYRSGRGQLCALDLIASVTALRRRSFTRRAA